MRIFTDPLTMALIPRGNHLAFVATVCMCAGLYPANLLSANHSTAIAYRMYNNFLKLLMVLCFISSYTQLYILLSAQELRYEEIVKNISISLLLILMLLRQIFIRYSPDVARLLSLVGSAERLYGETEDFAVWRIAEKERLFFKRHFFAYVAVLCAICVEYMVIPFYYQEAGAQDATGISKPFLLSLWFPFDQHETFCLSSFFIGLLVLSQVTTDALFFCLIRHPVVQLQMLQHYFQHFEHYSKRLEEQEEVEESVSYIRMFEKCIQMHWRVIEFLDLTNKNFSGMMLMDFVQSSFRITSICCVMGMSKSVDFMVLVFTLSLLTLTFVRECYIYFSGSQVIFLSCGLGDLAFETDWYRQSRHFKFMLQFFIQRTQKPLTLKIGPLADLSLGSLLSILRATYTYLTIVTGFDG
ncbi:hypothetical protein HUJ04_004087 [Dendroctonus ponderosae]|nr:hypothetical protein HUJ04_004087 [Dendroctonus ponderosae]